MIERGLVEQSLSDPIAVPGRGSRKHIVGQLILDRMAEEKRMPDRENMEHPEGKCENEENGGAGEQGTETCEDGFWFFIGTRFTHSQSIRSQASVGP